MINTMTPEKLIELRKINAHGISKNGKYVVYETAQYCRENDTTTKKHYKVSLEGGKPEEVKKPKRLIKNARISKTKLRLFSEAVLIEKIKGIDLHDDAPKSEVQVYDELNYRYWDTWHDGRFSHIFYAPVGKKHEKIDIMASEPFNCPMKLHGSPRDYVWHPEGKKILYVSKKLKGTDYVLSTNSNLYEYDLTMKATTNLTKDNNGLDTHPAYSSNGHIAWLRMQNDGSAFEKNDIMVSKNDDFINLTEYWDGTINSFRWSNGGKKIYFVAPISGTIQLFVIKVGKNEQPKQITDGQFDINEIVGQVSKKMVVSRCDMNHAAELFIVDLKTGKMSQLTHENDAVYDAVTLGKVEKRIVKTTDGKDMVCWVTYPPNFDVNKKYPTLLYCQGGPHSEVSQFYSTRWNFQLMSANGYIVIAPNRRGMPGHGVEWNDQISKDYGGQNIKDYLSAVEDIAGEAYVDSDRIGAIGASYGGFSVFYLASCHSKRFKSFIAHDGIFNWKSVYGTMDITFFLDWELGGAYWEEDNPAAQKTYNEFNPSNHVGNWDTPIMIMQGGKDFRVPVGQALEAFQAAQLQSIKSRLVYFPEENHWVLAPQNSLVWQREFFRWLEETL